jgi:hypothetical protein
LRGEALEMPRGRVRFVDGRRAFEGVELGVEEGLCKGDWREGEDMGMKWGDRVGRDEGLEG